MICCSGTPFPKDSMSGRDSGMFHLYGRHTHSSRLRRTLGLRIQRSRRQTEREGFFDACLRGLQSKPILGVEQIYSQPNSHWETRRGLFRRPYNAVRPPSVHQLRKHEVHKLGRAWPSRGASKWLTQRRFVPAMGKDFAILQANLQSFLPEVQMAAGCHQ